MTGFIKQKLYCKLFWLLIVLSIIQLPSIAQQQNLERQVIENLPAKCHSLFAPWAKTHPVAATEMMRRQNAHNIWVQKYPQANSELRAQMQDSINWNQSHPNESAQIQQFRADCARLRK